MPQLSLKHLKSSPISNYIFTFNNRNTRTRCETCSNLTINTPERHHWCRSSVFIFNSEHISHFFLVFEVLNLNK